MVAERAAPVTHYAPIVARRPWLAPRSNGQRLHAGVDLSAPPGTPVLSPEAGRVVGVVLDADSPEHARAWGGYGPALVVIEGASGIFHRLTHLASTGIVVRRGDIIASAGVPVGRISALAHTHWEVMVQPRRTEPFATVELSLDPLAWIVGDFVQYDAVRHGCAHAPGRTARTPRACRVGYRGSMAPAPGPRGGHAVPNPTPEVSTFAPTDRPSNSSSPVPEPARQQQQRGNRNGGFAWLALIVIAIGLNSGSRR